MAADTPFLSLFLILVFGLGLGAGLGWLLAGRAAAGLRSARDVAQSERDRLDADFRRAITDLERALAERDQARLESIGTACCLSFELLIHYADLTHVNGTSGPLCS